MIGALLLAWALGALGAMQLQVSLIKADPSLMPGGGRPAVVLRALLWPVIVAIAVVGLVIYAIDTVTK